MSKMDDESLLKHLQANEDDASQYSDIIGQYRIASMREYYREPYGNEEEGWSQIVTSEVQDTVEWILPELLDIFTSTDEAVVFEPTRAEDVQGAQQATDGCNYVFYKQNNGFLTLYTAFKDALMVENCAVHWRKETDNVRQTEQVQGASAEYLALLEDRGYKIEAATPRLVPVLDAMGQPIIDPVNGPMVDQVFDANLAKTVKKKRVKVEAFPPEQLKVKKNWTSPLLDECPYVCRTLPVTLSELKQMGYEDVTADELRGSQDTSINSLEQDYRQRRVDGASNIEEDEIDNEDESQATGWLRIEYVLVDFDGDGVAERRCIYRLETKILSNEECSHVQIATTSPILNTHQWDGMSIAECVSDIQRLKTDLTRAMVNAANLAVNPRKTVLTDANDSPFVNIDDLLDYRIGGIVRQKRPDALGVEPSPFTGNAMLPILEYVDQMGERRTGVSKQQQGLDPNALRPDRTAAEVMMTANAAKQRVKLIARIFAETLVTPVFKGILKLLTDGEMEPLAFRLRGQFVQYDPNEWRDGYDMTINVGLGTGDKQQQIAAFQQIMGLQMGLAQSPYGQLMIQPQNIYNTVAKIVELAGQKNVGDFIGDPQGKPLPPSPPPPQLMIEQQKMQQEGQFKQMELEYKARTDEMERQQKAELELIRQRAQQETDASRQIMEERMHDMEMRHAAELEGLKLEFKRWEVEFNAAVDLKKAEYAATKQTDPATTERAAAEIQQDMTQ